MQGFFFIDEPKTDQNSEQDTDIVLKPMLNLDQEVNDYALVFPIVNGKRTEASKKLLGLYR